VEDSFGSKSSNGSWNGIMAKVIGGDAEIGITALNMKKERYEVVAFTDILASAR
jgi:hypothetical protein